jgi:hypothetical protein
MSLNAPNKFREGIEFRLWGDAVAKGRGGLLGREFRRELGAMDVDHDGAPGPCVECRNAQRCAQGLACEQFVLFARFGGDVRWRAAARQPSAEIHARIYSNQPAAPHPTSRQLRRQFWDEAAPRGVREAVGNAASRANAQAP